MRRLKNALNNGEVSWGFICDICNDEVKAKTSSSTSLGVNPNPLWVTVVASITSLEITDAEGVHHEIKYSIYITVCSALCYLKTIKKYYELYKDCPSLEIDDKNITFIEDLLQTLGDKIK